MLVVFVVLVFPIGAATLALIAGDGHAASGAFAFVVAHLCQFDVAGGLAEIALNAGAGVAHFDFFEFFDAVVILGHGVLNSVRAGACRGVTVPKSAGKRMDRGACAACQRGWAPPSIPTTTGRHRLPRPLSGATPVPIEGLH